MPGVGMTDGEAPEQRWAADNAIVRSTQEMTPGHRQDTQNQHSGNYNMQKTFGISKIMFMKSFVLLMLDRCKGDEEVQARQDQL